MINYTPTPDFYNDYICHYNHYHDPKNGQFAKGPGGSSGNRVITEKQKKKAQKQCDKLTKKVVKSTNEKATSNYISAYNSQTKWVNDGLDKLNKRYEGKKLDKKYHSEAEKLTKEFQQRVSDTFDYMTSKNILENKDYKQLQKIVNNYGAENLDLMLDNDKILKEISDYEKKYSKIGGKV